MIDFLLLKVITTVVFQLSLCITSKRPSPKDIIRSMWSQSHVGLMFLLTIKPMGFSMKFPPFSRISKVIKKIEDDLLKEFSLLQCLQLKFGLQGS